MYYIKLQEKLIPVKCFCKLRLGDNGNIMGTGVNIKNCSHIVNSKIIFPNNIWSNNWLWNIVQKKLFPSYHDWNFIKPLIYKLRIDLTFWVNFNIKSVRNTSIVGDSFTTIQMKAYHEVRNILKATWLWFSLYSFSQKESFLQSACTSDLAQWRLLAKLIIIMNFTIRLLYSYST